MIKEIALINPESGWFSKGKHLPVNLNLGFLAIATSLHQHGFHVTLTDMLDLNFKETFVALLKGTKIFIVSVDIQTVKIALELSREIKQANSKAVIIWGSFNRGMFGKFINLFPQLALEPDEVDFISFADSSLVNFIVSDLADTTGMGYKQGNKIIIDENTKLEPLMDVDYTLVDIEKNYFPRVGLEVSIDKQFKRILPVFTGEGCPFSCTFCINSSPSAKRKFVLKDAEQIISEIEFLKRKYNITHLWLQDDNLFANKNRTFKLFDYLKRQPLYWAGQGRVEYFNNSYLTDEYFLSIAKNCCWFGVGYESYSDRLRKIFNKGRVTTERLLHVFQLCKKNNIVLAIAFIVGTIDETVEEMIENVQFILKLKKEYPKFDITYQLYRPYPGTPEFQKIIERHDFQMPQSIYDYMIDNPYDDPVKHFVWLSDKEKLLVKYLGKMVAVAGSKDSMSFFKRPLAKLFYRVGLYRLRKRRFELFFERYVL
ncbi:hypothetical protein ES702_00056 [subsurface metagenome]